MKPRSVWLWFTVCLAVLLAALGWVTQKTLRLESERLAAARDAEVQEKVRLALWRMDAAASALLIREGTRPPEHFRAFTSPANAWSNTFQPLANADILIPSPLLTEQAEHVFLHFERDASGAITAPQVPKGNERDVAESRFQTSPERLAEAEARLRQIQQFMAEAPVFPLAVARPIAPQEAEKPAQQAAAPQAERNLQEFTKRSMTLNKAQTQQQAAPMPKEKVVSDNASAPAGQAMMAPSQAGPFAAHWVRGELLLLREIHQAGSKRHQGVWLDWPALSASLLRETADLFPSATLAATTPTSAPDNPMRLASLPAQLNSGPANSLAVIPLWTPFRKSLAVAWGCVLLAALAVAALLRGTVALSERRGAFVSAVTHELRTPLTTFRLYAEILANGMLPTREKQTEYLATLQSEAERLSHLVENVLAYARLERGRAKARAEKLTLRELIERVQPTLERRAAQVGATLAVDCADNGEAAVQVDVGAVEQILFNLVDNACKYGMPHASAKIIHLETGLARGLALLRVRDHGQGIHRQEARRVFRPFHKSAQQAAHSAPGVGLGLALCRKLSRALGGDLRLDQGREGACFVLEMPMA